ncbi:MAG: hypothetical protein ACE5DI_03600 [Candidatus Micrarchaeia archaeon]
MNELAVFQLVLLALLVLGILTAFFASGFFFVVFVVFVVASVFFAFRVPAQDRFHAFFLLGFFSLLALAFNSYRFFSKDLLTSLFLLPMLIGFFFAFFIFYKFLVLNKFVETRVLGFSEGFAIVKVEAGLSHDVKPGIYAVESRSVKKGSLVRVKVNKGVFNSSGLEKVL